MIIITRRLARRIKTVFRQSLKLTHQVNLPIVQLTASTADVRIRCGNGSTAVEYHLEGEQPEQTLFIPFEVLADVEGGRDLPVEISSVNGKVTASWRDGRVPQFVEHDAPVVQSENFPPTPDTFTENPADLLVALHEAAKTTDAESSRFALGCIQFRGGPGDLVATDGRQALIQGGFSFPWDDDLLMPASKVFGSKQLPSDEPVFVGRVEEWVVIRVGPWTFWQRIETEARFPDVVSHVRPTSDATASYTLVAADRQFLIDNVLRLPGDDDHNRPITVDLNGTVAVRGKRSDDSPSTELVLSRSTRDGEAIRFNTDRRYVHRAAQLGFEQLHVYSDKSPVLARDERRQYFWALLEPGSAIAPEDNAIRIESNANNRDLPSTTIQPSRRSQVTQKPNSRINGTAPQPQTTEPEQLDPITAAETLRDSLRHSLQSTTALVRTLKRERKRNKAVESTLLSLRQLQAIDA